MSVLIQLNDGCWHLVPHQVISRYNIYLSAVEACSDVEVFPLPLSSEEYEKWLRLAILIDSDVADTDMFREIYWTMHDPCPTTAAPSPRSLHADGYNDFILYREDYKRVLAIMDPVDDSAVTTMDPDDGELFYDETSGFSRAILYCVPRCPSREEYLEIGRVVYGLSLRGYFELPFRAGSGEAPYDCVVGDNEYIYVGILYCDMLARGVRYRENELVMDVSDVSWSNMIHHGVSHVLHNDNSCWKQGHEEQEEGVMAVLACDGIRIESATPGIVAFAECGWVYDFYEPVDLYTRVLLHTISYLAQPSDNWIVSIRAQIGEVMTRRCAIYNPGDLYSVLIRVHRTLHAVYAGEECDSDEHVTLVRDNRDRLRTLLDLLELTADKREHLNKVLMLD